MQAGSIEEARQMLGKRVLVKDAVEGFVVVYGKDGSGPREVKVRQDVGGVLTFVGENEFLNWGLCATVDRMPIQLSNMGQIGLQEDRRIFKKR